MVLTESARGLAKIERMNDRRNGSSDSGGGSEEVELYNGNLNYDG